MKRHKETEKDLHHSIFSQMAGWFTGNIRLNMLNNDKHKDLFQSIFASLSVILGFSGPCKPVLL